MKRFVCVALSVLAVSCGGTSAQAPNAGGGRSGRGGRGAGTGAQPVAIARVSQKDVPVDIAAVGNVESNTTISVRSQVTGQLQQAFFHEGDVVEKGDDRVAIDPRPLQSPLQEAAASMVGDRSLLTQ